MPRLIINVGELQAFAAELKPGPNYIGRHWINTIQINHSSVSSRHCEVLWENQTVRIRDLGSTNGTFIDGQPVREGVLKLGQILQVGEAHIIMERPRAAANVPVAIPPLPAPEPFGPHFLADGSPGCDKHRSVVAGWQCSRCERFYCDECVHQIRRVGGRPLILCPRCSGHCQLAIRPAEAQPKAHSFFGFLSKLFTWRHRQG
jgi:hypothetical protein